MPHVFEIADRIHIHRLGKRVAVVDPKDHSMHEVVGIMTGAVVHDIEHPDDEPGEGRDADGDSGNGGSGDGGDGGTPAATETKPGG